MQYYTLEKYSALCRGKVFNYQYVSLQKIIYVPLRRTRDIAGVTSGAGGAWAPLAEILEEQKFESKREER